MTDLPGTDGPAAGQPAVRRPRWRWGLRGALSIALAGFLLGWVLPKVTGTRWSEIAEVLGRLSAGDVALLSAVWTVGLWCYSFVITATVPGISHAQAVTVNVASSAVSNLLPFGGALGLATTFAMTRSWGFAPGAVALSAVVTGVWNVFAKLALPMLGLFALALAPGTSASWLARPAAVGAGLLAVAFAVGVGVLWREDVARAVGRAAESCGKGVLRLVRSTRRITWDEAIPHWRHQIIGLVRAGWKSLTLGLIGFLGTQALLLYLILTMLGSGLGPAQVFAGFAFSRLLTTIVVTPGGTGFTETGTAGLLVALGGDPAVTTSAVLLFSGFVVFLEIPVGALGGAVWVLRRSWRRSPTAGAVA